MWSAYGRGYLFVPLVLPVLGLLFLRRTARAPSEPWMPIAEAVVPSLRSAST